MAAPEINYPISKIGSLFRRLPEHLFRPLASTNRHRIWAVLCRLYELRFGPDAPLPPAEGFTQTLITKDIECALIDMGGSWDKEDSEDGDISVEGMAGVILRRFLDSGWLKVDRIRFAKMVLMPHEVAKFMAQLVEFVEAKPSHLSAKIRLIDMSVQMVVDGSASGDQLSEAADATRKLLEDVRNIGSGIRDLMETLNQNLSTAEYVSSFFGDYIQNMFIGDYKELRTREHPLSKKGKIIERIESLRASAEQRNRLVSWYEAKKTDGDRQKAEMLYERDLTRVEDIQRVDEYLYRLDDEVRRANKRALAFITQRIKSPQSVDYQVRFAIETLLAQGSPQMNDPFPPGEMIAEHRLAEPRTPIERAPPSALRKIIVSDEQMARNRLLQAAQKNRRILPPMLANFVKDQMGIKDGIDDTELTLNSITEICLYQRLSALSLMQRRSQLAIQPFMGGFRLTKKAEPEQQRKWISSTPFTIDKINKTGRIK